MALRIEDYALIGDTHAAALVGKDGAIDWLCLPRFDSGACFAALLGEPRHGHWKLAPAVEHRPSRGAIAVTRWFLKRNSSPEAASFASSTACLPETTCPR